jgi:hypothetical protein
MEPCVYKHEVQCSKYERKLRNISMKACKLLTSAFPSLLPSITAEYSAACRISCATFFTSAQICVAAEEVY